MGYPRTVVPTAGRLGGYILILGRYDLLSIQACLSLFSSTAEEAAASSWNKEREQHFWSLQKQADPAWIQPLPPLPPKKWLMEAVPSGFLLLFSYFDLPQLQMREDKPQFLQPSFHSSVLLALVEEIDIMEVGGGRSYQSRDQRCRRKERILCFCQGGIMVFGSLHQAFGSLRRA